jgi:RNA polymerase sigma-70 factor (sigma-E family)
MIDRRATFEDFVAANAASLLRTAYLIAGDLGEAEDLVQESLLRVARRWPRVRRMEHPAAYARKILLNVALDGASRRSRRSVELDDPGGSEPRDLTAALELSRVGDRLELRAALARLPPRQRAVLVLRYYLDLSEAETAAALGCSQGTVKSASSRALARLCAELHPHMTELQGAPE